MSVDTNETGFFVPLKCQTSRAVDFRTEAQRVKLTPSHSTWMQSQDQKPQLPGPALRPAICNLLQPAFLPSVRPSESCACPHSQHLLFYNADMGLITTRRLCPTPLLALSWLSLCCLATVLSRNLGVILDNSLALTLPTKPTAQLCPLYLLNGPLVIYSSPPPDHVPCPRFHHGFPGQPHWLLTGFLLLHVLIPSLTSIFYNHSQTSS